MRKYWLGSTIAGLLLVQAAAAHPPARHRAKPVPHNLIIFVADGLRSRIVTPTTAPAMAKLRSDGVDLRNSHSVYPTLTTANASAIATGHQLGDTGDFANSIYTGFPVSAVGGSPTPFLENDAVLGELNDRLEGNYLDETSILASANAAGLSTAAIGKLGPVAIQDITARTGTGTLILDDNSGRDGGLPIADDVKKALAIAGLAPQTPGRGDNGKAGDARTPGTLTANLDQERWFVDVATKVVLPRFKRAGRPFAMVFWSRDPDGTQHNQGDSLNQLSPGINGPTSMAAIRNADDALAALRRSLKQLGLARTTNILVIADHGFSTISRQSATSGAAKIRYNDVPEGFLPPGFLAIDLAQDLALPLYDADLGRRIDVAAGQHPKAGNGLLGADPAHPDAIVAANGGTDLIYLPGTNARDIAPRIVTFLTGQDYTTSIFVDDALGSIPGTLPLSRIKLVGNARTPRPSIVVGFASRSTGCDDAELCSAQVADTTLQQGQGMHGSFSRADTHNFMAAIGPDFRKQMVDTAPVSNADIGVTAAYLLGLSVTPRGSLQGRLITEALVGGKPVAAPRNLVKANPAANGFATVLKVQSAGGTEYFDAAGIAGRTVGLDDGQ
ncbi:alkaline phosphatase family protein [Sphingomonas sp. H39-1-10]|uniref:alkaline phosphatase family protein n=1 Tax=Sphingomonas pollutisoli TaxID=3030829 RepID=UPI0023B8D3BC|nr:alkaline phosphatase family protein [Sphingomonas pollutisoli]MDF0491381.1 alkaline phosphatase family protein [Sphingomonas pollutisoli]